MAADDETIRRAESSREQRAGVINEQWECDHC